ncbi:MAG: hypothetical protein MUF15_09940, partial [Acidobacteria bacterium]|nr:hypothetical protein [Acidobacteriota bacterium]
MPLLVFPLFSFHKKDHPVNIKFKHFTVAQGLSQNSIYGITQDKYGYMWFGTMGGLNRFDGYSSRIYQNDKHNPNSLNQDIISTLITDKTGMLWIGTDSGGLARHDPGVGTFTRFTHDSLNPQSIGSNSINTVFEDSTGTLWIGAIQGGLNRFDPLTNTFKRYMPNPQNKFNIIHNTVQCILEKSPGILLIGTPHGIESFDIKSETFARVSPLYARAFCRDKSGNIWIGTVNKGLYLLKPGNEKPQQYFFPFSEFNKINRSMTIHAVFEDKGGAIWIGSNGNGLLKIDEALGRVARYSYEKGNPHSLSSNVITTIFQDSGGIMWFGTNSEGIESFDPMSEVFYDYSPLFAEEEIKNYPRSIYENQKDDLWIGTAGAGLIHYNTQSYLLEYFKHSANDPGTISHDDLFFVEPDYSLPSILWI